jgi:regulator of sigma E protease
LSISEGEFMALVAVFSKLLSAVTIIMSNLPLILFALLGLGFVIAFHELGHLLAAKLFNVYAPSFSIGFGPRIFQKQWGETTYALSAIPLGGYVELAGSAEMGQGEQAHAKDSGERSFASKPYWQKLLIMLGGIGFNLLFAYLALSVLFYRGAPCIGSWCNEKPAVIGSVYTKTPAEKAGLLSNDTIVTVDSKPTPTIGTVVSALEPFIKKPVTLGVERAGQMLTLEITPDEQTVGKSSKPLIGVAWQVASMSFLEAFKEGWFASWALMKQVAQALMNLTKSRDGLGGPLMLITQVTQFAGMGFKMFLFMLAFISINLALFNLLPLPIFDGGQVVFFTIETILGRPLSEGARENIHYYTWLGVIILFIYLTFRDVLKLSSWF